MQVQTMLVFIGCSVLGYYSSHRSLLKMRLLSLKSRAVSRCPLLFKARPSLTVSLCEGGPWEPTVPSPPVSGRAPTRRRVADRKVPVEEAADPIALTIGKLGTSPNYGGIGEERGPVDNLTKHVLEEETNQRHHVLSSGG